MTEANLVFTQLLTVDEDSMVSIHNLKACKGRKGRIWATATCVSHELLPSIASSDAVACRDCQQSRSSMASEPFLSRTRCSVRSGNRGRFPCTWAGASFQAPQVPGLSPRYIPKVHPCPAPQEPRSSLCILTVTQAHS